MANEMVNEILDTEPSDKACELASRLVDNSTYTSTALAAMALYLTELGDAKAAGILLTCAGEMAKHEAETL